MDGSRRRRGPYVGLIAVVIAAGLGSRRYPEVLPEFVATYAGDILWSLMVFLGYGFLAPGASTTRIASAALITSIMVECSQLYHAEWIDSIRRTTPGGLVLGFGFLWTDLICYAAGVLTGCVFECSFRNYVMTDRGIPDPDSPKSD